MQVVEIWRTGVKPALAWARKGSRPFYVVEHQDFSLVLDATRFGDLGDYPRIEGNYYEVSAGPLHVFENGEEVYLLTVDDRGECRGTLALMKADAPVSVYGDAEPVTELVVRVKGPATILVRDPREPWVATTENGYDFTIVPFREHVLERLAYYEPLQIGQDE